MGQLQGALICMGQILRALTWMAQFQGVPLAAALAAMMEIFPGSCSFMHAGAHSKVEPTSQLHLFPNLDLIGGFLLVQGFLAY